MAGPEWKAFYDAINDAALRRTPAILYEWIPGGASSANEFRAASIQGGAGDSLKVNLRNGFWKDWASGEKGGSNLTALYARIKGLSWKDATDDLAAQFGIEKPKPVRLVQSVWEVQTPIPEVAPLDEAGMPIIPSLPASAQGGEIKGLWCYLDRDGNSLCWRIRIETHKGKDFYPLTFCYNKTTGETGWRWKDLPSPRPLYGLEWLAMLPNAPVLVTQGEKKTEAARRLFPDWVVVNHPGGDSRVSTKHTDWSPLLARSTRIVQWPDNDDSGLRAAAQVASILNGRAQVVQPDPAWRKSWDLADAEAEGWTATRALEYLETHLITPKVETRERLDVSISGGDLEAQSQSIWEAVGVVNDPPSLLQSSSGLTIVDRDIFSRARRQIADSDRLCHWLTARLRFTRQGKEGQVIPTSPTDRLLRNLLVYSNPPLKYLRRVTEIPVLAPDSRLVAQEGFDEPSGIYCLPSPDLTEQINIGSVQDAVALIDDLLADFPFLEDCDRAHAIAFALLPILRQTIKGRTPLFRFEAPQPRTGKSLLMRVLARLTCVIISDMGPTDDEEEWRKRITAALRREPDAFLIDNLTSLESANLKKLLTDDVWEDRALGASENIRYPVQCIMGATINNPIISREILGRSLRIRLDARTEHPELRRDFRHPNLEEYASENRGTLVAALLTIAQGALEPDPDALTLGGYEAFCRRMSAILAAAKIDGFLGDRSDASSLSDEENALIVLVEKWADQYQDNWVPTDWLVQIAENIEGLFLGKSDSDRGKRNALGRLLRKHREATVGHWRIGSPHVGRDTRWKLISTNGKVERSQDGESDNDSNNETGEWGGDAKTPF